MSAAPVRKLVSPFSSARPGHFVQTAYEPNVVKERTIQIQIVQCALVHAAQAGRALRVRHPLPTVTLALPERYQQTAVHVFAVRQIRIQTRPRISATPALRGSPVAPAPQAHLIVLSFSLVVL